MKCTNPNGCSDPWPTGARLCRTSCYHKYSTEVSARWDAEASERESRGKYKGCPVCKVMVLFKCHHDGWDYPSVDLPYTAVQLEAIKHVRRRVETDGVHRVTGCPTNCRAVCKYRAVILDMQRASILPYIKGIDYDQLNRLL